MCAYFASFRNLTNFMKNWSLWEILMLRITQNKAVSSVQLQHVLGKSPSGGVCLAVLLSHGNGVILSLLAKIFATCEVNTKLHNMFANTSNPDIGWFGLFCFWLQQYMLNSITKAKTQGQRQTLIYKVNSTDMQPRFSFVHSRSNSYLYNLLRFLV